MQQVPVTSNLMEAVYFSPEDGRLRIRMRDGQDRLFSGVAEGDVASLVTAPSPDAYYLEKIRDKFPRMAA